VFDAMTGAAHTVTLPRRRAGYLTSTTPRSDFVAVTAVDYTFIANKNTVDGHDGVTTAGAITGTKQQFSALPARPRWAMCTGSKARPTASFDDYYVKWDGSVWVETTKPGQKYQFDAATMPWKLIKTGATTWEFRKTRVGRPARRRRHQQPSAVVHRPHDPRHLLPPWSPRLHLRRERHPLARWQAVQLLAETVTAVLDSDPIDREVSHNKVSILNHVVPFNKALMLFSDLTQFQFTASPTLTPKTARVRPVYRVRGLGGVPSD
jgi:hypothetical protein